MTLEFVRNTALPKPKLSALTKYSLLVDQDRYKENNFMNDGCTCFSGDVIILVIAVLI